MSARESDDTFTFHVCLLFFVFDFAFSWTLTPDEGAGAPKACEK